MGSGQAEAIESYDRRFESHCVGDVLQAVFMGICLLWMLGEHQTNWLATCLWMFGARRATALCVAGWIVVSSKEPRTKAVCSGTYSGPGVNKGVASSASNLSFLIFPLVTHIICRWTYVLTFVQRT